jgi:PAS domain S-box-containing protein
MRRVVDTGEDRFESRHRRKDGSTFDVEVSVQYRSAGGGQFIGFLRDITERKAVEQSLRASEERHRTIIQTALDGFWLADAEGRLLEVNAAYCRMSGYSEQELLGTRVADIEAAETVEDTAAHIRKVIATGEDRFESRHRRKDGSVFDVEVSVQYRPAAGQFIGFLRDVTERKAVERSLRESEERHRTIIQTAADGFWLVDLRGRLLEVNEAYCRMSGYSARELLAMSIPDLEALETPEETAARIQALIARGEERFESRHRRKDGSTFDVEVSVKYWLADAGRFVVFLRDITQRKHVAAALEEARRAAEADRAKLEAVMDALPVGLAIVDAEGGILSANAAFDRIWGKGRPVARSVADYQLYKARWIDTGQEVLPEEWASTRAVRQGETVIGQAMVIERFDGGHAYVLNSAAPILDQRGRPAGCAVAIQDIGRRVEAERALARSEVALRDANAELEAANLALRHNNEALEARVTERTADLAQRSAQLRALALDSTRAEERERQRVAQVIHDHLQQLLSVARINLGIALGRVRTSSIRQHLGEADSLLAESLEVTRSLTAELSPAILHRSGLAAALRWLGRWYQERFNLEVVVEAETDVDLGHEGRVALFRAVRELLFNVVKHAKAATARVQLNQTDDRRARVVVSDNGVGFDPEMLRAREGTDQSFGLSSLRERLELLGGRLEVDSAPGQGSSFTIIAPPPGPAEPETGSTPPVAPLKIAVRKHTGVRHGRPARKKPR